VDPKDFARLGMLLAAATASHSTHALDLDAVVDCRFAIERILHERRDWPAANPGAKPAFESLVTRGDVARVVEASLRDARRLRHIDAPALQAELERMASTTQDPDLLAELFAAAKTGEDAALCIARPTHVARDPRATGADAAAAPALDASDVVLPEIRAKGAAIDTRQEPPEPRFGHVAVWTGAEMVVFGGTNLDRRFDNGARYFPATDTWMPLPRTGAPAPRTLASAVWSGLDVIIFGGYEPGGAMAPDHGRYRPSNDLWGPVTATNAPSGRYFHTAVWTGTSMIVYGGTNNASVFADGATYTPASNTWLALPAPPPGNARQRAAAAWTGTEMLVFGGISGTSSGLLATGLRFTPGTPGTWAAMGTANVPTARALHTGLWFGPPVSRFVVWAGETTNGYTGDGALYDPAGNGWTPMSNGGAPLGRSFHGAVSTGTEMIVWGGTSPKGTFGDGARYSPASNAWLGTLQATGAPSARHQHTAVWTGDAMIVWGGNAGGAPQHSGGRYSVSGNSWTPTWVPVACGSIPGNVLPNCGFESGLTGWVAPSGVDARLYRGGSISGRQPSSGGSSPAFFVSQCFPVIGGGQRYEFGAHVRVDRPDSSCSISLGFTADPACGSTPGSAVPFNVGAADEWTFAGGVSIATGPFDVAGRIGITCFGSFSGFTARMDDAFVVPLGDAVFSDGFE
jgi:hypothetical protein